MKTFTCIIMTAFILLVWSRDAFTQSKEEKTSYSYVGSQNCKKCHIKQYKSWEKSAMALSYDILKPGQRADAKKKAGLDPKKDYTNDKSCLACHTTGYGQSGGFVNMEKTPNLAGVGCEMCHGAGGEYTKDEHMSLKNKTYKLKDLVNVGLVSPPQAVTCTERCHNKKSPFFQPFDFAKRKSEGTHTHELLKYKHD